MGPIVNRNRQYHGILVWPWTIYWRGNVQKCCARWIRNYARHILTCYLLISVESTLVMKAMHKYLSLYFGNKNTDPNILTRVGSILAVHRDVLSVKVFSLIFDNSVDLSVDIQSAGDLMSENLGSNPAFSRGRNLSPFDFNNACLCQSTEINNNHVNRQNQVRKTTGRWVEFKFLAWSSVAQSVCQRAFSLLVIWYLRPWIEILHSAE